MKETHVIVEYKKEDFEQKLNRFINNGWNIINSNIYVLERNAITIDKNKSPFDINRYSHYIYYALLMKEED